MREKTLGGCLVQYCDLHRATVLQLGLARLIQSIRGDVEAKARQLPSPAPIPTQAAEPARPRLGIHTGTSKQTIEDPRVLRRQPSGSEQVPHSPARNLSRANSGSSRPQSPFAGSPALRVEVLPEQKFSTPRNSEPAKASQDSPGLSRNGVVPVNLDRNDMPLPARSRIPSGTVIPSNPLLNVYGLPATGTSSVSLMNKSATLGRSHNEFSERIRVCVRKRPLNRKELKRREMDITTIIGRRNLVINEPKMKVDLTRYTEQHQFVFDEVFDEGASNDEVYRRTAKPLVDYTFTGGKATCFVYGQTGSGKTFTSKGGLDTRYFPPF